MKKIISSFMLCLFVLLGCGNSEYSQLNGTKLGKILNQAEDDNHAFELVSENMNENLTYMKVEEMCENDSIVSNSVKEYWNMNGEMKSSYFELNDFYLQWSVSGNEQFVQVSAIEGDVATVNEQESSNYLRMFDYRRENFDLTCEVIDDYALFSATYTDELENGKVIEVNEQFTVNRDGYVTKWIQHRVMEDQKVTIENVYKDFNKNVSFDFETISSKIKELDGKSFEEVKKAIEEK